MIRRILIVVTAALWFAACRPGEGDYCQCPDECRGGLVCAQNGAVIDSCIDAAPGTEPGRCIEQDAADEGGGGGGETTGVRYDVGGKRDFEPSAEESGSTTGAGTGAGSSGDATSSGDAGSSSTTLATSGGSGEGGTSTGSTGALVP